MRLWTTASGLRGAGGEEGAGLGPLLGPVFKGLRLGFEETGPESDELDGLGSELSEVGSELEDLGPELAALGPELDALGPELCEIVPELDNL
jgi:hypothetical protein